MITKHLSPPQKIIKRGYYIVWQLFNIDTFKEAFALITKELIERINCLSRKQRDCGLTKEEQVEQAELRQVYLDCIKSRVKDTLDHVKIVDEPSEPKGDCDCGCDGKHKH
jgi:uncharacterized protein YnzC (UPF0291/DUF896 family)